MQEGHELTQELVVPDPDPLCDSAPFAELLLDLQRRLGELPPGVTITLSVGARPTIPAEVAPAATETDMRIWYSPRDLATLHDVRIATVQKWAREGRFPGVRRLPNGAIRIPKAAADAVLSAPLVAPGTTDADAARGDGLGVEPKRAALAGAPRRRERNREDMPRFDGWRAKMRPPA